MARNSACSKTQMQDAEKNERTRKRAACTGLRAVMTRNAASNKTAENIKKQTEVVFMDLVFRVSDSERLPHDGRQFLFHSDHQQPKASL